MVVAGGGVKRGVMYGESDELGFSVAQNKASVTIVQATLLYQLGFNHEHLTYRFQGAECMGSELNIKHSGRRERHGSECGVEALWYDWSRIDRCNRRRQKPRRC
jgi:hypothetical protein